MTSSARDRAIEKFRSDFHDVVGDIADSYVRQPGPRAEMVNDLMETLDDMLLANPEVRLVPAAAPIPPRVQVSWVDHDEDDGDLHETGWIMAVEGEIAVINCDCGPRTVRRPLSALTLDPSRRSEDTRP